MKPKLFNALTAVHLLEVCQAFASLTKSDQERVELAVCMEHLEDDDAKRVSSVMAGPLRKLANNLDDTVAKHSLFELLDGFVDVDFDFHKNDAEI